MGRLPRFRRPVERRPRPNWAWGDDIGCPRCLSMPGPRGTCCACKGTRLVSFDYSIELCGWVWAKDGCQCHTCTRLRGNELGEVVQIEARRRGRPRKVG